MKDVDPASWYGLITLLASMCIFGALVSAGACTDEPSARRILSAQGFRKIQITGYEFFACGRDDSIHTGFSALNHEGGHVDGVVCCGLIFKSCTVRFDR